MLTKGLQHFASLREARASLREDGYCVSHSHLTTGEVWTDTDGDCYAIVRNIPWFNLGTFVKLGHN